VGNSKNIPKGNHVSGKKTKAISIGSGRTKEKKKKGTKEMGGGGEVKKKGSGSVKATEKGWIALHLNASQRHQGRGKKQSGQ